MSDWLMVSDFGLYQGWLRAMMATALAKDSEGM